MFDGDQTNHQFFRQNNGDVWLDIQPTVCQLEHQHFEETNHQWAISQKGRFELPETSYRAVESMGVSIQQIWSHQQEGKGGQLEPSSLTGAGKSYCKMTRPTRFIWRHIPVQERDKEKPRL